MTDSPDGNKPHPGEKRNGSASSASALAAAAGGVGKDGGSDTASGRIGGGTPSATAQATESPNKSRSGPKRRRRRGKRRNSSPSVGDTGALTQKSADNQSQNSQGAVGGSEGQGPAKQAGNAAEGPPRRKRRRRGRNKSLPRALQGHPLSATGNKPAQKSDNGPTAKGRADQPGAGADGSKRDLDNVAGQRAHKGEGRSSYGLRDDRHRARYPARPKPQLDDLYAALDLGTNNCRLLIAQPTRPGQFRVVDAFSRIVRLGEGLAATGRLSADAMDRSVDALRVCASKLESWQLRVKRLIATEACRSAENGVEFLQRVERETGLELEIVDRETEARLAVAGCTSLVDRETNGLVLFDIGGGSSEIAMIDLTENRSNRLANHIHAWTSLPVGVVTLSERYGGASVTRETFAAMVEEVDSMLDGFVPPLLPAFAEGADANRFHLLGTSGTVTTLAGLHLELPRYDRRKVDGIWLTSTQVDTTLERLLGWSFAQRAANPCIGTDRADLVLAGCAILESIRKRWPSERMRVADRGLREGLLNEMMAEDGAWRRSSRRHRARMKAANAQRGGEQT